MILNTKFHEILFISSRATLATKFLSHTHTDTHRHFPKIVKSCSGHPKTCKSIENRKSKIYIFDFDICSYIRKKNGFRLENESKILIAVITTNVTLISNPFNFPAVKLKTLSILQPISVGVSYKLNN